MLVDRLTEVKVIILRSIIIKESFYVILSKRKSYVVMNNKQFYSKKNLFQL